MNFKSWFWRVLGAVYLGSGTLLAIPAVVVLVWFPGQGYYQPPHACQCGECLHERFQASNGETYCSVFPPPEIKFAGIDRRQVLVGRAVGTVCAALGLLEALTTALVGGFWLKLRATWDRARGWFILVSATALPAAMLFLLISVRFKATYGFVPM